MMRKDFHFEATEDKKKRRKEKLMKIEWFVW